MLHIMYFRQCLYNHVYSASATYDISKDNSTKAIDVHILKKSIGILYRRKVPWNIFQWSLEKRVGRQEYVTESINSII